MLIVNLLDLHGLCSAAFKYMCVSIYNFSFHHLFTSTESMSPGMLNKPSPASSETLSCLWLPKLFVVVPLHCPCSSSFSCVSNLLRLWQRWPAFSGFSTGLIWWLSQQAGRVVEKRIIGQNIKQNMGEGVRIKIPNRMLKSEVKLH